MSPRFLRVSGIIFIVLAVYTGISLFGFLVVTYYFRFRSVDPVTGSPFHHWDAMATWGMLSTMFVPSLLFVVGLLLRRAGRPPSPNPSSGAAGGGVKRGV